MTTQYELSQKHSLPCKEYFAMKDHLLEFDMGLLRLAYVISGACFDKQIDKIKDPRSRSRVKEELRKFRDKKSGQPSSGYYNYYKNMHDEYELFDSLENDIEKCVLCEVDPCFDLYRIILAPNRAWIHGWRRIAPG